ncbi:tRNA (adenosine(37)-N6)-dimethylallyltransferase MiaA [Patescibacteria group bacterium]|nr:tRNA (adenosine(37)-N6)-dimethylallyltransferase MiaA [Patescibacteria group bacterium]
MKQKLVAILGPTAAGKTSLSLFLASKFDGYILSADSCQVYRGLDIGTAKASPEERKQVPHFLIDIKDPDQDYNVSNFKTDAQKIIEQKSGLPFLVGGTGLYFDALLKNLTFAQVPPDSKFRKELENRITREGLEAISQELIEFDPKAKEIIDLKNPRRVIRALEVRHKTGQPFSNFQKKGPALFNSLILGVFLPREELYQRIDIRVDQMIKKGLLDEMRALLAKYPPTSPAFSSLGYKQLLPFFAGHIDQNEAIDEIKKATRHYAKRQLTWFKKYKNIHSVENQKQAVKLVNDFIRP